MKRWIATIFIAILGASLALTQFVSTIVHNGSADAISVSLGRVVGVLITIFGIAFVIQWIWGFLVRKERAKGSLHRRVNRTALVFAIMTLLSSIGHISKQKKTAFEQSFIDSCMKQESKLESAQQIVFCRCMANSMQKDFSESEIMQMYKQRENLQKNTPQLYNKVYVIQTECNLEATSQKKNR